MFFYPFSEQEAASVEVSESKSAVFELANVCQQQMAQEAIDRLASYAAEAAAIPVSHFSKSLERI